MFCQDTSLALIFTQRAFALKTHSKNAYEMPAKIFFLFNSRAVFRTRVSNMSVMHMFTLKSNWKAESCAELLPYVGYLVFDDAESKTSW